ncbi:MAG: DUF1028 domain-containing protein [Chloroflexota bacterium]|nr:DUF1028 domain-containing protein [Chloroflexota bacterium]
MLVLNTFSIVAYDPNERAWGVAVASKFLACAALVSWARAGAGAVATQSYCKVGFGLDGLALMESGVSAPDALARLLAADPGAQTRQVGIVDKDGRAAAHTGAACHDWAGHHVGEGFAIQGNILTGADVIADMAAAFTGATGELADRLYAALKAGDDAGGDRRGKQAAGIVVVRPNGGYGGDTDRYLDLRVDDDPAPVAKMGDLLTAHHLFFGKPTPEDRLPITADIARELQAMLVRGGYATREPDGVWDDASIAAFFELVGTENVEERWSPSDAHGIDRVALAYLRKRLG